MIDYARERYEELPSWANTMCYMLMLVLGDTSCRVAEIKRMKWREIDENERIIHIPIGKHQGEYFKFCGFVDGQLPRLLREVKKWKKSEYVHFLENGKQYSIEGIRKIFYRIAEELGIDSNPNAVRSCLADWYDRNTNLSDEEIARQIGNEPQTLRRHYKKRKLETVKATLRKLNGNNKQT